MRTVTAVLVILAMIVSVRPSDAANSTRYYSTDGDSTTAWEIQNGLLVNTFSTFYLGYPIAVRDTIWLGERDDTGAVEYTLAGVPTGNTSVGGNNFSQLLDGAAGPNANYGVECCGDLNSVTIANVDFSNQQTLFNLPPGFQGIGIAYDWSDNSLYISEYESSSIYHYSLGGVQLGSLYLGQQLVGLAYEQSTNTLWGFNRDSRNLVQFNQAGQVLQDVDVPDFFPFNPWGGEMPVSNVPEPGAGVLIAMAMLAAASLRRR